MQISPANSVQLTSAKDHCRIRILLKTVVFLFVVMTTTVSASSSQNHQDYFVAISPVSPSDQSGAPVTRTQYRVGDNVWLKVTMTNLSTETLNVPKGEDYSRPKLIKDGLEVSYRRDIAERIEKQERGGSYRVTGFLFLNPYQPQSDVINLTYWYDLQPGYYQVDVERLFFKRQRVHSNTISFEVLPRSLDQTSGTTTAQSVSNRSIENYSDSPAVVQAVAPEYPLIAATVGTAGRVAIDLKIRNDGTVSSTQVINGVGVFAAAAKSSARRWLFTHGENRGVRSARLSFDFRMMPPNTPGEDLLPIFTPPYGIEIRALVPEVLATTKRASGKQ